MEHSINYYVSKLKLFLNNKYPSLFENSILNNVNIKLLLGLYITLLVILIGILVFSMWKLFKKEGIPGYYSLIPGLNLWMLYKLSGLKGYLSIIVNCLLVLMLVLIACLKIELAIIPLLVIIGLLVLLFIKLSITYNKNISYSVGLLLLPLLFFPILAFEGNRDNQFEIVEIN